MNISINTSSRPGSNRSSFRLNSFQSVATAKLQATRRRSTFFNQRHEYINAAKTGDLSVIIKHQKPTYHDLPSINDENDNDNSLLHIACVYKQLHIVHALIKIGFPIDLENRDGDTALHLCLRRNETYIPIIEALVIDGNANITARNNIGETPQLILTFSNQLKRISSLNKLLKMEQFRKLEASNNLNSAHGMNPFTKIKSMISEMNSNQLSIYRLIFNKLTKNHMYLRKEDLFEFFKSFDIPLFDIELRTIMDIMDISKTGHINFDDFLMLLLIPTKDWNNIIINNMEWQASSKTKLNRLKQSATEIPFNMLKLSQKADKQESQNEISSKRKSDNKIVDMIDNGITKQDYKLLEELMDNDVFGCNEHEIDYIFKTLTKVKEKEELKEKMKNENNESGFDDNNQDIAVIESPIKFVTDCDYIDTIESIDFELFKKATDNQLCDTLELMQQSKLKK